MGGGGLGGLFSDGSATSAPFTAQASGGPVTIPQGSTIADIAPGLTGFTPQEGGGWQGALKSLVSGLPNPGRGIPQPGQGQIPGMTLPSAALGKYATGNVQAPQTSLTQNPAVILPQIAQALSLFKNRMRGF